MEKRCCNCETDIDERKMLYDKKNNEYLCKICFIESLIKKQKNNIIYGFAVNKYPNVAYAAASRVFDEKLLKNLKMRDG